MSSDDPTIHASAVLFGARAVLIRGPSGSGKSRLARALIDSAGTANFARLVADDRVHVAACGGRLVASAPAALQGLMEVRGVGICRMPFEPAAVVGLVVDLAEAGAERLPPEAQRRTVLAGVAVPRLAVAPGEDALPAVRAALYSHPRGARSQQTVS